MSAHPTGLLRVSETRRTRLDIKTALRNGVLRNMLAMWGVQFIRKTLPLVTMPYLGRVLGPAGWGLVAFFQGYAAFVTLLVEYGFNLSATRGVARCRESKDELADLFAGVLGAQLLLGALGVAGALVARAWVPMLADHPGLLAAALLFALADGFNPYWYFMGMERMGMIAALEIVCKSAATVALFIVVRSPADAWLVLALASLAPLVSLTTALVIAYRHIPFRIPNFRTAGQALRTGWGLFLFRSAESLYTLGNAFVLGLLANTVVVGYFAGAEKISRAVYGLFNPIREALYPRLSALMERSPAEAARLARWGMLATTAGSLLVGGVMFWAAPLLIRILLGPQFEPAIPVLRVFALLPPLLSLTQGVGLQWLLPQGRESAVNRVMIMAGPLNVLLALALVPAHLQLGMAAAVTITEAFVCTSLIGIVLRDPSHKLLLARQLIRVKS